MVWAGRLTEPEGRHERQFQARTLLGSLECRSALRETFFVYQTECKNSPKIPCRVFKPVNYRVPQPVIPKTLTELELDAQAARYMEKFWTDILIGAAALGAGYSAPAALGGAGASGLGWRPAFAY